MLLDKREVFRRKAGFVKNAVVSFDKTLFPVKKYLIRNIQFPLNTSPICYFIFFALSIQP